MGGAADVFVCGTGVLVGFEALWTPIAADGAVLFCDVADGTATVGACVTIGVFVGAIGAAGGFVAAGPVMFAMVGWDGIFVGETPVEGAVAPTVVGGFVPVEGPAAEAIGSTARPPSIKAMLLRIMATPSWYTHETRRWRRVGGMRVVLCRNDDNRPRFRSLAQNRCEESISSSCMTMRVKYFASRY